MMYYQNFATKVLLQTQKSAYPELWSCSNPSEALGSQNQSGDPLQSDTVTIPAKSVLKSTVGSRDVQGLQQQDQYRHIKPNLTLEQLH